MSEIAFKPPKKLTMRECYSFCNRAWQCSDVFHRYGVGELFIWCCSDVFHRYSYFFASFPPCLGHVAMFFITMELVSCSSGAVVMFFIVTVSKGYSNEGTNQSTFATRIFSFSSSFFCRSFHFWRKCLVLDDLAIQLQAVRLP
jgi:hypothetical protein